RAAVIRRRDDGAQVSEPRRAAGLALPPARVRARGAVRRNGLLLLRLRVRTEPGAAGAGKREADRRDAGDLPRASRVEVGWGAAREGARLRALRGRVPRRVRVAGSGGGPPQRVPRRRRVLLRRARAPIGPPLPPARDAALGACAAAAREEPPPARRRCPRQGSGPWLGSASTRRRSHRRERASRACSATPSRRCGRSAGTSSWCFRAAFARRWHGSRPFLSSTAGTGSTLS